MWFCMFEKVKETLKILDEKLRQKGTSLEKIYKEAEGREKFNIPFDKIIENLDLKVFYTELGEVSGKCEGNKIFINKKENTNRKRFTFCHELYHYLNNQTANRKSATDDNDNKDKEEMYANVFATAFLMPEKNLKEIFEHFKKSISMTANYFGVSLEAMGYRLVNCGLSR